MAAVDAFSFADQRIRVELVPPEGASESPVKTPWPRVARAARLQNCLRGLPRISVSHSNSGSLRPRCEPFAKLCGAGVLATTF